MDSYKDPNALINLLEQHDLYGKTCFWYIREYGLSILLNTPIFDQYISTRWTGRVNINSSILDFSTTWMVIDNKFNMMTRPSLFNKMKNHLNCINSTNIHEFSIVGWKRSMKFRFTIEAFMSMVITVVFQYYISDFNFLLHRSNTLLNSLRDGKITEDIEVHQDQLEEDLHRGGVDLMDALFMSCIYLLVPMQFIIRRNLYLLTKRNKTRFLMVDFIDLCLFGTVLYSILSFI